MTGMIQSRLPVDGGYGTVLPSSPPTIAEVLSADGVACGGWHCNPHTVGARPVVDALAEQLKRRGYLTVDPRVPASETVDAFETWLARRDPDRRFAYLHLMDTHMPYRPPAAHWEHSEIERISAGRAQKLYQRLSDDNYDLDEAELGDLRQLYAAEAEYVDRELERLVSTLEAADLWESTLLVVTADHGKLFGERTALDGSSTGHPSYLCQELMHVPLVLAGGSVPSVDTDDLVSGTDIAPTTAAALGVEPAAEWAGEPVGSTTRERVVSTVASNPDQGDQVEPERLHVAVRTGDRALLWWRNDAETECYRRTDEGERPVSSPAEGYESMRETARSQEVTVDSPAEEERAVDRQRLKDLGYLS